MEQLKKLPADIGPDYAFIVDDNSMVNAGICKGDVVFINACDHVSNGQIAAVKVGENVRLRKYWCDDEYTILTPANTAYNTAMLTEAENNSVQLIGRVVVCMRIYE